MTLLITRCASTARAQQLSRGVHCSPMPQRNRVGIFWDVENCQPARAAVPSIVRRIREIGEGFGAVHAFKAYADAAIYPTITAEITAAGVSLVDCAHHGQSQVADAALIVDMGIWARDSPSATIILITGDGGFTATVTELRLQGYTVVVISLIGSRSPRLEEQASHSLCWHFDVCGCVAGKKEKRLSQDPTPKSAGPPLTHRKSTASSPVESVVPVATFPKKGVACKKRPLKLSKGTNKVMAPAASPPLIPTHFQPLVTLLERRREGGTVRPYRSAIAGELLNLHANAYLNAGVTGWRSYATLAEQAGLVELGNFNSSSAWISLRK